MNDLFLRLTAQPLGRPTMYEVTIPDGDVAFIDIHAGKWIVTFYSFRHGKFYWFSEDEVFDLPQDASRKIQVLFSQ